MILVNLFLWAVLSPLFQAHFGPAAVMKEKPAHSLHGEWVVVSLESSGYQLKGTEQNPMTVRFTNDRMIVRPGFAVAREFSLGLDSEVGPRFSTTTTIKLSSTPRVWALRLRPNRSGGRIDLEEQKDDEVTRASGTYRVVDGQLDIRIGEGWGPAEPSGGSWAVRMRLKRNGGPSAYDDYR